MILPSVTEQRRAIPPIDSNSQSVVNLRAGMLEIELAVREIGPGKHLVVVYRKLTDDGFIIDGVCDPPHAFFGEEGATMAIADFQDYLTLIPAVHRAPQHAVWLTYDEGADTLYVNFKKPSQVRTANSPMGT